MTKITHGVLRSGPKHTLAAAATAAALLLFRPAPAGAETERVASYSFPIAWATAVRFLRIDEGFTIVERDQENGYVMFKLTEERKEFPGSLQVIATEDQEARKAVRLVIRINDRPRYMESGVLDRLVQKLHKEHGDPPAPPPKKKPPEEGSDEERPKDREPSEVGKEKPKKDDQLKP